MYARKIRAVSRWNGMLRGFPPCGPLPRISTNPPSSRNDSGVSLSTSMRRIPRQSSQCTTRSCPGFFGSASSALACSSVSQSTFGRMSAGHLISMLAMTSLPYHLVHVRSAEIYPRRVATVSLILMYSSSSHLTSSTSISCGIV